MGLEQVNFELPFEIQAVFTDSNNIERSFRVNFLWKDVTFVEEFAYPEMYTGYEPKNKAVLILIDGREVIVLADYELMRNIWWSYKEYVSKQTHPYIKFSAQ